jgi:hypothetical protein
MFIVFLVFLFSLTAEAGTYKQIKASRGGTGKFYHGREIASVMGFSGVAWLDRDEREQEEKIKLMVRKLAVKKGHVVADTGAVCS